MTAGVSLLVLLFLLGSSIAVAAGMGLTGVLLNNIYSTMPMSRIVGELTWSTTSNFILTAIPFYILFGEILLRSTDPRDPPRIIYNFFSAPNDLPTLREGFKRARDVLGWDVHLLHDVHHRLTPIEAGRLGKELEPYRLFWLEDAVPAENQANFRLIRQHTTTPLAVPDGNQPITGPLSLRRVMTVPTFVITRTR